MKTRMIKFWERLRSSFWFLPTLMVFAAVLLSILVVHFNTAICEWLESAFGLTFSGGAAGASEVMSTIAGSMITVAGVVFSMTLVALSLASSQLGPRMLGNFMRDTTTQVVLGTFVATFLYCLLVLRTIRRAEELTFVPHAAVALGVVLAVLGIGLLIYFIHHVALSIQADEMVARIGRQLVDRIEMEYKTQRSAKDPDQRHEPPEQELLLAIDRDTSRIGSDSDGYIQYIDRAALLEIAVREDIVLRLELAPGHYVVAGHPIVTISPGGRLDDELRERINDTFAIGNQRSPRQDIEFVIDQLVEIALRALSPGVNDSYTAIRCLDRLGSGLCRLAERAKPNRYSYDSESRLRVIARIVTFADVADSSFNQIRQNCRTNAAVTLRLLETLAVVAASVVRPEDRVTLRRHTEMVARGAREGLLEEEDRGAVEDRMARFDSVLAKRA